MNVQLIKALANRAGYNDQIYEISREGLEKLVKLAVLECASLTLDYKSDDYYNGWLDYRDEIKKHFGVEL